MSTAVLSTSVHDGSWQARHPMFHEWLKANGIDVQEQLVISATVTEEYIDTLEYERDDDGKVAMDLANPLKPKPVTKSERYAISEPLPNALKAELPPRMN